MIADLAMEEQESQRKRKIQVFVEQVRGVYQEISVICTYYSKY